MVWQRRQLPSTNVLPLVLPPNGSNTIQLFCFGFGLESRFLFFAQQFSPSVVPALTWAMLQETLLLLLILQFLNYIAMFYLLCPSLFSHLNIYTSILGSIICLIIKSDTVCITWSLHCFDVLQKKKYWEDDHNFKKTKSGRSGNHSETNNDQPNQWVHGRCGQIRSADNILRLLPPLKKVVEVSFFFSPCWCVSRECLSYLLQGDNR